MTRFNMAGLLLLPMLLAAAPCAAQTESLPPAYLTAPHDNVQAVLAPVSALFAGIAARDPAMIERHVVEGATITIANSLPDGSYELQRVTFSDWLDRLSSATEQLEERMPNPVVDIDGAIAFVWGFYTFYRDGEFSHCGADHFSLVREAGAWKIANLAFSRRTTDCGEQ